MLDNVEKFVDELAALPEAEQTNVIGQLDPAEVIQLTDYKSSVIKDISGLRKEKNRVSELANPGDQPGASAPEPVVPAVEPPLAEAIPTPVVEDSFGKKLRDENQVNARVAVYTQLGLEEADYAAADAMFEKLDDGSVNQANIEQVYKRASAAAFPDKFVAAQATVEEMRRNADEFTANNAGAGNGTGEGGDGKPPVSQGAQDLLKAARKQNIDLTPEAAERIETEGMSRVYPS